MKIEIGKKYAENLKRLEQIFEDIELEKGHSYFFINRNSGTSVSIMPVDFNLCYKCKEHIDCGEGIKLSIFYEEGILGQETYFFHFRHYV